MRAISWNVNGIRACHRKGFTDWLKADAPDVVMLQEIKAMPEQLGPDLLTEHGYHVVWNPAQKKGYSGTATFTKEAPTHVALGIGEPRFDDEGRITTTTVGDYTFINAYFPHGQRDFARMPYKTDFYRALRAYAERLRAEGHLVCLSGDWNTAHTPLDIKNDRANRKTSGFTDADRALLDEWLVEGDWIDSWRRLHPGEEVYSWWSVRGDVRARNIGWRIDYHIVTPELWPRVTGADIHTLVMGSDHCPVEISLT